MHSGNQFGQSKSKILGNKIYNLAIIKNFWARFDCRQNKDHIAIAAMFGRVNVWQIAKLKVAIWQKKFGEWIDCCHNDTISKLKFSRLKFGEQPRKSRQICQTFPLPNIPAIYRTQYM